MIAKDYVNVESTNTEVQFFLDDRTVIRAKLFDHTNGKKMLAVTGPGLAVHEVQSLDGVPVNTIHLSLEQQP